MHLKAGKPNKRKQIVSKETNCEFCPNYLLDEKFTKVNLEQVNERSKKYNFSIVLIDTRYLQVLFGMYLLYPKKNYPYAWTTV